MTKGWKTSEFWLTALFNLSALLTVVAGIVPSQAAPLVVAAAGIVTALYNFGRSVVKAGPADKGLGVATGAGTSGSTSARVGAGIGAQPGGVPQRRASDTVGREVAEALERAAVAGVLKSGLGVGSVGRAPREDEPQGSEVFDERNAG